jgi:TolA-binding protein
MSGAAPRDAIREYRDDALLERVRVRINASVARPRHPRRMWQTAAALLLFGLGVGVGRGLPGGRAESVALPETARATAETARTGTTAAPRTRPAEVRDPEARPRLRQAGAKRVAVAATSQPEPSLEVAPAPVEIEVVELSAPSSLTGRAADRRSAWLELAETGDYAGALAELERSQVAHVVLATGSVEELMTMAEVARFAGNPERAIQALSQVVDRYGGDPNAPLAAMMLGNLLSRSGDSAGAARAFALNRSLSPGGDFAEDALVREFDLALAAGDAELAARLFDQYAREFPGGPRVYAMRYELDELLATKADPTTAPTDGPDADAQRPDGPNAEAPEGPSSDEGPRKN